MLLFVQYYFCILNEVYYKSNKESSNKKRGEENAIEIEILLEYYCVIKRTKTNFKN